MALHNTYRFLPWLQKTQPSVSLASIYTHIWHPTHTSPKSCVLLFSSTGSSLMPRGTNTACSELHSAMLYLPFVLFKEAVLCALHQPWPGWAARAFQGNISYPSTGISRTQTQRVGVATGSTHPVSRTPASQGVGTSPETCVVRELRAESPTFKTSCTHLYPFFIYICIIVNLKLPKSNFGSILKSILHSHTLRIH